MVFGSDLEKHIVKFCIQYARLFTSSALLGRPSCQNISPFRQKIGHLIFHCFNDALNNVGETCVFIKSIGRKYIVLVF